MRRSHVHGYIQPLLANNMKLCSALLPRLQCTCRRVCNPTDGKQHSRAGERVAITRASLDQFWKEGKPDAGNARNGPAVGTPELRENDTRLLSAVLSSTEISESARSRFYLRTASRGLGAESRQSLDKQEAATLTVSAERAAKDFAPRPPTYEWMTVQGMAAVNSNSAF